MSEDAPIQRQPRCTAAEVEMRVAAILDMLAEGYGRPAILRFAADTWGLSHRSTDDYLARARTQLAEQTRVKAADLVDEVASWFRLHYHRETTKDGGDPRVALQAAGQLCRLLGLNASDRNAAGGGVDKTDAVEDAADMLRDVYGDDTDGGE